MNKLSFLLFLAAISYSARAQTDFNKYIALIRDGEKKIPSDIFIAYKLFYDIDNSAYASTDKSFIEEYKLLAKRASNKSQMLNNAATNTSNQKGDFYPARPEIQKIITDFIKRDQSFQSAYMKNSILHLSGKNIYKNGFLYVKDSVYKVNCRAMKLYTEELISLLQETLHQIHDAGLHRLANSQHETDQIEFAQMEWMLLQPLRKINGDFMREIYTAIADVEICKQNPAYCAKLEKEN